MPSTTTVDVAKIDQAIVWTYEPDAGEPKIITLPGSGVLTAGTGSIYRLANGSTLRGVDFLDENATPIEDSYDNAAAPQIVIEVEHGGTLTIVNEDGTVSAGSRILVPGGANGTLSGLAVQIFRVRVDLGSGYVWRNRINLRPLTAGIVGYTPGTAADWNPAPTLVSGALDQLAERSPFTGEGSATWAANAQTVWSYELDEGEVYGGSMTIVTGYLNGSTLSRSIADVSFVGSREVGGAAAVTQGTATENGSGALASGTVTATAVGNTIAVRLNFPSLNGVAYFAWSHKPLVPPTS
jgi:hypothetical protein